MEFAVSLGLDIGPFAVEGVLWRQVADTAVKVDGVVMFDPSSEHSLGAFGAGNGNGKAWSDARHGTGYGDVLTCVIPMIRINALKSFATNWGPLLEITYWYLLTVRPAVLPVPCHR